MYNIAKLVFFSCTDFLPRAVLLVKKSEIEKMSASFRAKYSSVPNRSFQQMLSTPGEGALEILRASRDDSEGSMDDNHKLALHGSFSAVALDLARSEDVSV